MNINQRIDSLTLSEQQQLESLTLSKNNSTTDQTLVAIASDIKDHHLLTAEIQNNVNVVILDENKDAIEQITIAISKFKVSNLHIICHGAPGFLKLGKTTLSAANLEQYHHLLAEWDIKNILLWSCEVAAKNTDFLNTLHQLTGANIAASANYVGNEENYSNWQLEYQIGNIAESSIFTEAIVESYSGLFTDPGSNYTTAQNISVLGSTQTFSEVVGSTDRNDLYRFTLNGISEVNLELTDLQDPAELAIVTDLNNDDDVDDFENIEGDSEVYFSSNDREISATLPPGTYAIRVYTPRSHNNTSYTLSASATSVPSTNPTDPGEDFNSALNLGSLSGTQTFTDAVGSLDRSDYYKFTIDENSQVSFNLTDLTDPAELSIVTDFNNDGDLDNGEVIEGDSEVYFSSNDREISTILAPGTYAIRVDTPRTHNNTGYTLTTTAPGTAEPPDEEIDYDSRRLTINGTYEPISGDFNGDGNGDIFLYRPGTGSDYMWLFDDDGNYDSQRYSLNGTYTPITGDFDGSGTTDIFWYRPGTGSDHMWSFDSDGSYDSQRYSLNGTYTPITGDFDGSGTTDIFWYRPGTGSDHMWLFDSDGSYESERYSLNGTYTPITGDFDGNNIDDILWYRPGVGSDRIWTFETGGEFDSEALTINGSYEPVVEDFDGNGYTDILWYSAGVGSDFLWSFD